MDTPDEQNPAELLKRIATLEARSAEIEDGVARMAAYLGVMHILQDTGPK